MASVNDCALTRTPLSFISCNSCSGGGGGGGSGGSRWLHDKSQGDPRVKHSSGTSGYVSQPESGVERPIHDRTNKSEGHI